MRRLYECNSRVVDADRDGSNESRRGRNVVIHLVALQPFSGGGSESSQPKNCTSGRQGDPLNGVSAPEPLMANATMAFLVGTRVQGVIFFLAEQPHLGRD